MRKFRIDAWFESQSVKEGHEDLKEIGWDNKRSGVDAGLYSRMELLKKVSVSYFSLFPV
jgi:hypothetical protein